MPHDTGTNYNAFGHDPDGSIAYLAAWFFGPNWVLSLPRCLWDLHNCLVTVRCLPAGYVTNSPPHIFGPPTAPYLKPPMYFHPCLFDALKYMLKYCGIEEGMSWGVFLESS
jgi:hypothetical protein